MEEYNSKSEDRKKLRRKIRKLRVATLVIIVLSVAAISLAYYFYDDGVKGPGANNSEKPGQETEVVYRGYVFEKEGPLWKTKWSNRGLTYNLYFRFQPEEVAHVPLEGSLDKRIDNKTVFLTIDGSDDASKTENYGQLSLAVVELSRQLVEVFEKNVTAACTSNSSEACKARPVVACETEESAVIYFKDASEPRILLDGNCITIEGRGEDYVKATDKLLYKLLKIME